MLGRNAATRWQHRKAAKLRLKKALGGHTGEAAKLRPNKA
jgi:hypothetical protein